MTLKIEGYGTVAIAFALMTVVGCGYVLSQTLPDAFQMERYERASVPAFEIINVVMGNVGRALATIAAFLVLAKRRSAFPIMAAAFILSLANSVLYSYPTFGAVFANPSVSNIAWHYVPLLFYGLFLIVLLTKAKSLLPGAEPNNASH
ncbi:hypothetical protein [Corallincola spongiicola]|uniref:Uncharacterized protein n=1 Tax=Corallincola spongiicola TaxID=2520508 RepID=A0ABY1WM63_9GAMM|nr:hypothetical protein [Corallincola spongiicola]TAA42567.1 hypothetical protein EXY25_14845 [Corallincola spongiicola]